METAISICALSNTYSNQNQSSNSKKTDNTTAKRKGIKRQTIVDKILHNITTDFIIIIMHQFRI
jgi:hypothetical protein